jgi:hypothetical protein
VSSQTDIFARDLLLVVLLAGIAFLVWVLCRMVIESRPSQSAVGSRAFVAKSMEPQVQLARQGPPLLPDPDVESGSNSLEERHKALLSDAAQWTGRQPRP